MKRWLLATLLLFPITAQAEEVFSAQEKQQIMKLTLQKFWGQTVDSKGQPIMPKDDAERATLPVSREQASYMIDKGAQSGLAEWCNVNWQERFSLLMKSMRANKYSDTQLGYIGLLHGVAQSMTNSSMENQKCDAQSKQRIQLLIKEDVANLKKSLKAS